MCVYTHTEVILWNYRLLRIRTGFVRNPLIWTFSSNCKGYTYNCVYLREFGQIRGRRPMFQKLRIYLNYLTNSHCKYTVRSKLVRLKRQNEVGCICIANSVCVHPYVMASLFISNGEITPLGVSLRLDLQAYLHV